MLNDAIKKTKLVRKTSVLAVPLVLLVVAAYYLYSRTSKSTVRINTTTIDVEVAKSEAQQQRGLCCRDQLAETGGMLFIFKETKQHRFWMKDTKIPLDIYWIDAEKRIIHIEEWVPPSSYPRSFGADKPSRYVLETNAGFARKRGIKVGDRVRF